MSIKLRWLGTACFEFRLPNGEVLIVDPYMHEAFNCPIRSDDIKRADLICITHGHFDHILDVGGLANRLGSTVLCSEKVGKNIQSRFGVPEKQIQAVTAGETLRRGSIEIEVVKAIHVDNRQYFAEQLGLDPSGEISAEDMVKKVFSNIEDSNIKEKLISHMGKYPAGEQLNYIFQFPGNLRLYFFGSTPAPELLPIAEASQAQVLILQLLMGREELAFDVAVRAGASIVIPSHHDAFFPGQRVPDLKKFKGLFENRPNMSFVETVPGKWYEIKMMVEG